MDNRSFADDLQRYTRMLYHWVWLLAVGALTAGLFAFVVSSRMTPIYQANSKVLINEAPANRAADYASVLTSERLAQTYAQLLNTRPVIQGAIDLLDLPYNSSELEKLIQVQPVRDTQLIVVQVEDTDPERAALIVNTLVQVLAEQNQSLQGQRFLVSKDSLQRQLDEMNAKILDTLKRLESVSDSGADRTEKFRVEANLTQYRQIYANLLLSFEQVRLSEAQSISSLVQVEPAYPPNEPVRPRILNNTLIAVIVGLLLAIGVVFLIEAMDDTVKGPEEVTAALELPVLGSISKHKTDIRLVAATEPRSPIGEAFRSLRTNLQFASVGRQLTSLLITSPSPSDGKSTIASNLAIVLAQSGLQVVIMDADLRRPNVHHIMGLPNRRGISNLFVTPGLTAQAALHQSAVDNLRVLTAGEIPPNPSELLGSMRLLEILRQLQEIADIVIIDAPPVMAVTDAAVLSSRVDGVLLVLKPGVTNLGAAQQAAEQLKRVGANVLGVVLNEVDAGRMRYRYHRYQGYYHGYHEYYDDYNRKPSNAARR